MGQRGGVLVDKWGYVRNLREGERVAYFDRTEFEAPLP